MTAPQPSDPSTPPPAPMEPLTSTFALRPRFFLPWAMYGSNVGDNRGVYSLFWLWSVSG